LVNEFFTVTNYHLNIAKMHGEKLAQHHQAENHSEPLGEEELHASLEDSIVFLVTGEKEHDVDESYLIIDAFEEGYYREENWEV